MALNHVVREKQSSIFLIFDKLFKSDGNAHVVCADLLNCLRGTEVSVGSITACEYTAKRLVRGLSSKIEKRQCVYFSALSVGLSKRVLKADTVWDALQKELKSVEPSKHDSSQMIMTVLTAGAIIRSGVFVQSSSDVQSQILKRLLDARLVKTYFQTSVVVFLIELLETTPKSVFSSVIWPSIQSEWNGGTERQNEPELVALILVAVLSFPKKTKSFVEATFNGRKKLYDLFFNQAVHYSASLRNKVLQLIIKRYASDQKQLLRLFEELHKRYDGSNRNSSVFMLEFVKNTLNAADDISVAPHLLNSSVINLILSSHNNDALNLLSKSILELLTSRLTQSDNELVFEIVQKFLTEHGDVQSYRKTKTHTVQTLISLLNFEQMEKLTYILEQIVLNKYDNTTQGSSSGWEKHEALVILGQLGRNKVFVADVTRISKYSNFLLRAAFSKLLTNSDLKAKAVDVFYKFIELRGVKITDAVHILSKLVLKVNKTFEEFSPSLSDSAVVAWKDMVTAEKKMKDKDNDKRYIAVRLFLLHMGLMLFKDPVMACSSIQELLQCFQRLENDNSNADSEEPHWVEVTVDLLLLMLSRENKTLRHVVNVIFPNIVPHLTPSALQQIVDALDPCARNDVLKHVDSDDSDESDGSASGDENSVESAIEDPETEKETVNDKLRMAVRNALGYSAALTDDESVDMDDMNEEEEQRLNETLANAFKMFRSSKGSKKKQSKDDEAVTHFRNRILDLVEIIISNNPSVACCLELIPPLISLLEFSIKNPHQKPLHKRLENVLKKFGTIRKFSDVTHTTYEDLICMFKALLERETPGLIYVEMAPIIIECCGLLIRASAITPAVNDTGDTLEEYCKQLLDKYFKNNDRKVPYGLFSHILRMSWEGSWKIAQYVMKLLIDKDLKLFKKQKLVELLETFYKNNHLHSSATEDCKSAACKIESKFINNFVNVLNTYNSDMKAAQIASTFYIRLIPFIHSAVTNVKKFRQTCNNQPEWGKVVEQLLLNPAMLQKKNKKLAQLAALCDLVVPEKQAEKISSDKQSNDVEEVDQCKKLKRKRSDQPNKEEQAEEDTTVKSKKKKKKHNHHKLKIESRNLREAISSEGLQAVSFASINLDTLNNEGDESSAEEEKPKKLKKDKKVNGTAVFSS